MPKLLDYHERVPASRSLREPRTLTGLSYWNTAAKGVAWSSHTSTRRTDLSASHRPTDRCHHPVAVRQTPDPVLGLV